MRRGWLKYCGAVVAIAAVAAIVHSLTTTCAQSVVWIANAMPEGDLRAIIAYRGTPIWSGDVRPGEERRVALAVDGWWIEGAFDVEVEHDALPNPMTAKTGSYIAVQELLYDNYLYRFTVNGGGIAYEGYPMSSGVMEYGRARPFTIDPLNAPGKWLLRFSGCADRHVGEWLSLSGK